MVPKVVGSIPISHPRLNNAGIVQWLVCKFSKLEMRVRFSLPAPKLQNLENFRPAGEISEKSRDMVRLMISLEPILAQK